jgi:hypothetical protein
MVKEKIIKEGREEIIYIFNIYNEVKENEMNYY